MSESESVPKRRNLAMAAIALGLALVAGPTAAILLLRAESFLPVTSTGPRVLASLLLGFGASLLCLIIFTIFDILRRTRERLNARFQGDQNLGE